MDNEAYNTLINSNSGTDILGQELIRDDLLPSILGNDSHEISYWAGKRLSRTHRLQLMKIWKPSLASSNLVISNY